MERSNTREELSGTEWDFLAVDQDGSLAILSTAGYGPIPSVVLNAASVVNAATGMLPELRMIGQSIDSRVDRAGDYSDWYELSRRGLYAYDWRVHRGPYERVSTPTVALSLNGTPPGIAQAAELLRLPFRFADTASFGLDESSLPHS